MTGASLERSAHQALERIVCFREERSRLTLTALAVWFVGTCAGHEYIVNDGEDALAANPSAFLVLDLAVM